MTERLTLTVEEAAALLGVSRGTAYEAARTGELPTVRLGRRLLVPKARLQDLLGGTVEQEGAARKPPKRPTPGWHRASERRSRV